MNEKALEGNKLFERTKSKKTKEKQWSDEQEMLNTDVLHFISALIGCRIKAEDKKHMKDVYLKCYGDFCALSANDFSALWINTNYDLFTFYGNDLPAMV
jgi:hypothetical protein